MSGPEVVLEVIEKSARRIGGVGIDEPSGSISNYANGIREIVLFGWLEGQRGVWRSLAGIDTANTAVRAIASFGFELLSDLSEPYEMEFAPELHLPAITIRFRVVETL